MSGDRTLSPKAQEAVAELLRCVRSGFTGSFVIEMKDGVPQLARTTTVHRFGSTPLDRNMVK